MSRGDLRRAAGLSQTAVAQHLGVSRSTVQRYEYGTGANKKVSDFYAKLNKSDRLYDTFFDVKSKVEGRIKALRRAGVETPAMDWLSKRGGIPSNFVIAEDTATVQRRIATMREFLDKQTSTLEGYNRWRENVISANIGKTGLEDAEMQTRFWDIYNKIKKDDSINKYIKTVIKDGNQIVEFDSNQLISNIRDLYERRPIRMRDILDDDFETWVTKIIRGD